MSMNVQIVELLQHEVRWDRRGCCSADDCRRAPGSISKVTPSMQVLARVELVADIDALLVEQSRIGFQRLASSSKPSRPGRPAAAARDRRWPGEARRRRCHGGPGRGCSQALARQLHLIDRPFGARRRDCRAPAARRSRRRPRHRPDGRRRAGPADGSIARSPRRLAPRRCPSRRRNRSGSIAAFSRSNSRPSQVGICTPL